MGEIFESSTNEKLKFEVISSFNGYKQLRCLLGGKTTQTVRDINVISLENGTFNLVVNNIHTINCTLQELKQLEGMFLPTQHNYNLFINGKEVKQQVAFFRQLENINKKQTEKTQAKKQVEPKQTKKRTDAKPKEIEEKEETIEIKGKKFKLKNKNGSLVFNLNRKDIPLKDINIYKEGSSPDYAIIVNDDKYKFSQPEILDIVKEIASHSEIKLKYEGNDFKDVNKLYEQLSGKKIKTTKTTTTKTTTTKTPKKPKNPENIAEEEFDNEEAERLARNINRGFINQFEVTDSPENTSSEEQPEPEPQPETKNENDAETNLEPQPEAPLPEVVTNNGIFKIGQPNQCSVYESTMAESPFLYRPLDKTIFFHNPETKRLENITKMSFNGESKFDDEVKVQYITADNKKHDMIVNREIAYDFYLNFANKTNAQIHLDEICKERCSHFSPGEKIIAPIPNYFVDIEAQTKNIKPDERIMFNVMNGRNFSRINIGSKDNRIYMALGPEQNMAKIENCAFEKGKDAYFFTYKFCDSDKTDVIGFKDEQQAIQFASTLNSFNVDYSISKDLEHFKTFKENPMPTTIYRLSNQQKIMPPVQTTSLVLNDYDLAEFSYSAKNPNFLVRKVDGKLFFSDHGNLYGVTDLKIDKSLHTTFTFADGSSHEEDFNQKTIGYFLRSFGIEESFNADDLDKQSIVNVNVDMAKEVSEHIKQAIQKSQKDRSYDTLGDGIDTRADRFEIKDVVLGSKKIIVDTPKDQLNELESRDVFLKCCNTENKQVSNIYFNPTSQKAYLFDENSKTHRLLDIEDIVLTKGLVKDENGNEIGSTYKVSLNLGERATSGKDPISSNSKKEHFHGSSTERLLGDAPKEHFVDIEYSACGDEIPEELASLVKTLENKHIKYTDSHNIFKNNDILDSTPEIQLAMTRENNYENKTDNKIKLAFGKNTHPTYNPAKDPTHQVNPNLAEKEQYDALESGAEHNEESPQFDYSMKIEEPKVRAGKKSDNKGIWKSGLKDLTKGLMLAAAGLALIFALTGGLAGIIAAPALSAICAGSVFTLAFSDRIIGRGEKIVDWFKDRSSSISQKKHDLLEIAALRKAQEKMNEAEQKQDQEQEEEMLNETEKTEEKEISEKAEAKREVEQENLSGLDEKPNPEEKQEIEKQNKTEPTPKNKTSWFDKEFNLENLHGFNEKPSTEEIDAYKKETDKEKENIDNPKPTVIGKPLSTGKTTPTKKPFNRYIDMSR